MECSQTDFSFEAIHTNDSQHLKGSGNSCSSYKQNCMDEFAHEARGSKIAYVIFVKYLTFLIIVRQ